jgi:hypothetical protein
MTGFSVAYSWVTKLYLPIVLLGLPNVLRATRSRSVRNGSQTSTEDFWKRSKEVDTSFHHAKAFGNNIQMA